MRSLSELYVFMITQLDFSQFSDSVDMLSKSPMAIDGTTEASRQWSAPESIDQTSLPTENDLNHSGAGALPPETRRRSSRGRSAPDMEIEISFHIRDFVLVVALIRAHESSWRNFPMISSAPSSSTYISLGFDPS